MSNDVTVKLRGDKKHLDEQLKKSRSNVTDYAKHVKSALLGIAGVVAAGVAVKSAFSFAKEAVQLANVQVEAETKLAAVLKATGGAAGFSLEQLKERASVMQEQLGVGDEVILQNQAILATFKEVKGDNFEAATRAAIDMSSVMGTDLKGSIVQVGKALNDPIKGVSALSEVGVSFTQAQKDQIAALVESGNIMGAQQVILQELQSEFGGAAEAAGNTFAGQLTKLQNTVGDLYEEVGKALIPILLDGVAVIRTLIDIGGPWINSFLGMENAVGSFADSWRSFASDFVATGVVLIIDGLTFLEQAWANWYNNIDKFVNLTLLGFITAFESIKHELVVNGPEWLNFFYESLKASFTNQVNFVQTALKNMTTNIWDFLTAVTSWFQGKGFDFKMTGLLEGFEATMAEAPKLVERQMSDLEKSQIAYIASVDRRIEDNANRISSRNEELKQELLGSISDTRDAAKKADDDLKVVAKPQVEEEKKQIEQKETAEETKVAAKELKKASEGVTGAATAMEESTQAGETTSLEGLYESIASGAFSRTSRTFSMGGGGQMAGADRQMEQKKVTAAEKQVKALEDRNKGAKTETDRIVEAIGKINTGVV